MRGAGRRVDCDAAGPLRTFVVYMELETAWSVVRTYSSDLSVHGKLCVEAHVFVGISYLSEKCSG